MDMARFDAYVSQNPAVREAYESTLSRMQEETEKDDFIKGVLYHADNRDVIITGSRIQIRRACIADADFMSRAEQEPDNALWVANWNLGWRIQKLGDDNFLQTIIERRDGTPIGFAIFRNMLMKENQVELKRIALMEKGKGYGKEALYLIQDFAFNILHTEKLYLSTRTENIRAQSIYKTTGFTPETPDPCVYFHMTRGQYESRRREDVQ